MNTFAMETSAFTRPFAIWKNKLQAAGADVMPSAVLATQRREMAEPGMAEHR